MRRSQIAPGVHLSYDAAQKFNRCRISIHFAFPARRETATAHALLPLVMERGYADCPDMTQMTKKLARLYGADLTVDCKYGLPARNKRVRNFLIFQGLR